METENTTKMNKTELLNFIEEYPIIPVFYNDDLEICKNILKSCYEGGIRVFEFVNRGTKAKNNFCELLNYKEQNFPDLILGIGTILNKDTALDFLRLGAQFIVSPIFKEELAQVAIEKDCLWIPGCMTPTEIIVANEAGCQLIKLFPGDTLGPGFLKSIRPLFPQIKFMPTGGVEVSEENIKTWFAASVSAVGLGSKLFKISQDEYNYQEISDSCSKLLKWAKN